MKQIKGVDIGVLKDRLLKLCEMHPNGCWLWKGWFEGHYGKMALQQNPRTKRWRFYSAHRISYMIHKGEIDEGMTIDHLCNNPACVNPDHLEQVTDTENKVRAFFADKFPKKNRRYSAQAVQLLIDQVAS